MGLWWVLNSASCIRIPNSRQGKQFPLALRHCKFQLHTRTYRDKCQKARIIDSQVVGCILERYDANTLDIYRTYIQIQRSLQQCSYLCQLVHLTEIIFFACNTDFMASKCSHFFLLLKMTRKLINNVFQRKNN
jgi:hypothetical protein